MYSKFKRFLSTALVVLTIVNLTSPVAVFAATPDDDAINTIVQSTERTETLAGPEETVTPSIVSVSIESNNQNKAWAKTGDIVSLKFETSTVDPNLSVSINGETNVTLDSTLAPKYTATYAVSADDIDGAVTFIITYNDTDYDQTTDSSVVTVDNTAPVVVSKFDFENSEKLKMITSTVHSQLHDEGLVIFEDTGSVVSKTTWSVPTKNSDGSYTYLVDFVISDQAGNETLKSEIPVLLKEAFEDDRVSEGVTITLFGDTTISTHAELGKEYSDPGANYVWDGSSALSVWFTGDLNTQVVKTGYKLNYNGASLVEPELSQLRSQGMLYQTRLIDVSDTVAPGPVKDFSLTAGNGYISLKWTNPTDLDFAGVQIWKSTTLGVKGEMILFTSKETTCFEDTAVINGTTYYYTLVAVDLNANSSVPTVQLSATPLAPQIASTDDSFVYNGSSSQEEVINGGEVKSDDSEKDSKNETKGSALPLLGLIALLILLVSGFYLLYLQNPEWFEKLKFWGKNKTKNKK